MFEKSNANTNWNLKIVTELDAFKDSEAKGALALCQLNGLRYNCAYRVIVASQTC